MFLTGIEQLRSVEWGKNYLWSVRFQAEGQFAIPAPFDQWFPAIEIEENVSTLISLPVEAFMSTYKIPKSTSVFDVRLTFMDDLNHTIFDWLDNWVNLTLLNGEDYTARLGDPGVVRILQVAKLNAKREPKHIDSYLVYPEGALYFHGNSEAAPHIALATFIIVGTADTAHDETH